MTLYPNQDIEKMRPNRETEEEREEKLEEYHKEKMKVRTLIESNEQKERRSRNYECSTKRTHNVDGSAPH